MIFQVTLIFSLLFPNFSHAADFGSCPADQAYDCHFGRGLWPWGPCYASSGGTQTTIEDWSLDENRRVQTKWTKCDCQDPTMSIETPCYAYSFVPKTPASPRDRKCGPRVSGSIVDVETSTVIEKVPVSGAPFELVYFSGRQMGYKAAFKINYPLLGSTFPSDLVSVGVTLNFSDRSNSTTVAASPTSYFNFDWDGKNNSGDYIQGGVKAKLFLSENASPPRAFPDVPTLNTFNLGSWNAKYIGLGGWNLSIHHFYNIDQGRIYYGDGGFRPVESTLISGSHRVASEDGSEVYEFDLLGNHLYTKNGLTGAVLYSFSYDSAGRLLTVSDSFSNITSINRDTSGFPVSIVNPDGGVTYLSLDSNGFIDEIENPAGETYLMEYWGTDGLIKRFETPKGLVSSFIYDTEGNLVSDADVLGHLVHLTQSLVSGNLTFSSVSAEGRATSHTVYQTPGSSNYTRQTTLANGASETYSYSGNLHMGVRGGVNFTLQEASDIRFGNQVIRYDLENYVIGSTSLNIVGSQSATLSNPSDPFSIISLTNTSNFNGKIFNSVYDGSSKTRTFTTAEGRTSTVQINNFGQPVSFQYTTLIPIDLFYDFRGRLWKFEQGPRDSSWTFDSNGYVNSFTNALNETTNITNDIVGRPLSITYPDSRVIQLTYDDNGNVTSVTPPGRTAHSFLTNLWNLVSTYLPPALGGTVNTEYEYNNDKQLTQIERPGGQIITFGYGASTGTLDSITTPNESYSYTTDGQTGQISSANSLNSTYNNLTYYANQVATESVQDATTSLLHGYVTFNFNNDTLMSQEILTESDWSTSSTINYSYDDDGLRTSAGNETLSYNSITGLLTGTSLGSTTDSYVYNSFGEVTGYTAKYAGSTIYSYSLTRDDLGRVSTKIETMNSITNTFVYSYDVSGRLVSVTKNGSPYSSYTYDSNNNITSGTRGGASISGTYDAQDRIITWGTKTYTHNLNGERTQVVNSSPVQTFNLTYNDLGYLKSVQTPTTTINYQVDGFMRRASKSTGSTRNANYIYNQDRKLMAEMSSLGRLVRRYVYASKAHVPDYYVNRSGTRFRIFTDHLGSVRLVVNASNGTIVQRMEHDEFGKVLTDTAPGTQAFGFAGGVYDSQTGYVHFDHREYDPEIGRWLSKDPIQFGGGDTNLYGYVMQDPVNFVDPEGMTRQGPDRIRPDLPGGGGGLPRGNNPVIQPPSNPTQSPGRGWEWRGRGPVGSDRGAWYNPGTRETLHPDLNHGPPYGPHWDYIFPGHDKIRIPTKTQCP